MTYPAASPQPPRDALAGTLKRTEIQHSPSSVPGREIVQVLTEIPAGVESGWHTHPGEEVGYIVAGTVEMAVHGRPALTLHAGDGFSSRPARRTTRVTSAPARDTCCPPTSSRPDSRWPRSPRSRAAGDTPPCPPSLHGAALAETQGGRCQPVAGDRLPAPVRR
jgi:hypothetical protein